MRYTLEGKCVSGMFSSLLVASVGVCVGRRLGVFAASVGCVCDGGWVCFPGFQISLPPRNLHIFVILNKFAFVRKIIVVYGGGKIQNNVVMKTYGGGEIKIIQVSKSISDATLRVWKSVLYVTSSHSCPPLSGLTFPPEHGRNHNKRDSPICSSF